MGGTKEEREGVPFLGLPAAGTHRGGRIWPEKGAAEIVLQLRREAVVQRREGSEEGPGRCNSARGDCCLSSMAGSFSAAIHAGDHPARNAASSAGIGRRAGGG